MKDIDKYLKGIPLDRKIVADNDEIKDLEGISYNEGTIYLLRRIKQLEKKVEDIIALLKKLGISKGDLT